MKRSVTMELSSQAQASMALHPNADLRRTLQVPSFFKRMGQQKAELKSQKDSYNFLALMASRSTPISATNASTAELMAGREIGTVLSSHPAWNGMT